MEGFGEGRELDGKFVESESSVGAIVGYAHKKKQNVFIISSGPRVEQVPKCMKIKLQTFEFILD